MPPEENRGCPDNACDADFPIEIYTKERVAEFLLSNAVDAEDYARSVEDVKAMGLDPESIDHLKPGEW